MNEELKNKLNYLNETKSLLRQAINSLDGNITEDDPFYIYPDKVQDIINTTIIPQSSLNELVKKVISINNEKMLKLYIDESDNIVKLDGIDKNINSYTDIICPTNPDVKVRIILKIGAQGSGFANREFFLQTDSPIILPKKVSSTRLNLCYKTYLNIYNNSDKNLNINFKLSYLKDDSSRITFGTYSDKFSGTYGPIKINAHSSELDYSNFVDACSTIGQLFYKLEDGNYYFTEQSLDDANRLYFNTLNSYQLTFIAEEV